MRRRSGALHPVNAGLHQANDTAEFAVAALEPGAEAERLYSGPSGKWGLIGLPDEDGWFILREGYAEEPELLGRTIVYRGSPAGGEMLGSVEGEWAGFVPAVYWIGKRQLAPGPSVYAYLCDQDDGCSSHRLTLDPVGIEEVARVALPEPTLRFDYARPLACGGADVIVTTSDGTDSPTRYWNVRIPGREAFP